MEREKLELNEKKKKKKKRKWVKKIWGKFCARRAKILGGIKML